MRMAFGDASAHNAKDWAETCAPQKEIVGCGDGAPVGKY